MKDFTILPELRAGLHTPYEGLYDPVYASSGTSSTLPNHLPKRWFPLTPVTTVLNKTLPEKDKLCQKSVGCCIMGKKILDNTRGVHKNES